MASRKPGGTDRFGNPTTGGNFVQPTFSSEAATVRSSKADKPKTDRHGNPTAKADKTKAGFVQPTFSTEAATARQSPQANSRQPTQAPIKQQPAQSTARPMSKQTVRMGGSIKIETVNIGSAQDLATAKSQRDILIVAFHKDGCRESQQLAPDFANYSQKFRNPNTLFAVCDTVRAKDAAQKAGVKLTPTVQFYIKGKLDKEVRGPDSVTIMAHISKVQSQAQYQGPDLSRFDDKTAQRGDANFQGPSTWKYGADGFDTHFQRPGYFDDKTVKMPPGKHQFKDLQKVMGDKWNFDEVNRLRPRDQRREYIPPPAANPPPQARPSGHPAPSYRPSGNPPAQYGNQPLRPSNPGNPGKDTLMANAYAAGFGNGYNDEAEKHNGRYEADMRAQGYSVGPAGVGRQGLGDTAVIGKKGERPVNRDEPRIREIMRALNCSLDEALDLYYKERSRS